MRDELRQAVLWCVEQLVAPHDDEQCSWCGHSAWHHRADDAGPPPDQAEFRCVFPMPGPGPAVRLCICPDMVHTAAVSS